jgi:hypothetical protein
MKISQVREILKRNFPERDNWPGKEAEIIVLSKLCRTEREVVTRIQNPGEEYQEMLWEQQRRIEEADPEAGIEFQDELRKLSSDEFSDSGNSDSHSEKEELREFLEKNSEDLTRAQCIVLYQNCRNLSDAADLLDSINFADLVHEMELQLEERDKDKQIENLVELRFEVCENNREKQVLAEEPNPEIQMELAGESLQSKIESGYYIEHRGEDK